MKIKPNELSFFKENEFHGFYGDCNPKLLVLTDLFRYIWDNPVAISSANGAVGRYDETNSQHNINYWDEVRALDLKPKGLTSKYDLERAFKIARDVGFTGIGLYPEWSDPGIHVDIRNDRTIGDPLYWGAYYKTDNGQRKQEYVYMDEGLSMALSKM